MLYSEEEIKVDFSQKTTKDFYLKYILRSSYWYFEKILGADPAGAIGIADEFKAIVSKELDISFNNIAIVGSGKIGYSLSPNKDKLFKGFRVDDGENSSDLDIAIVSSKLFHYYWDLFRKNYRVEYDAFYAYISRGIYRGYINEKYLLKIKGCRAAWSSNSKNSKKSLYNDLFIKHEATYRLYRSWEDFEEYHICSLDSIKRRG